MLYLRKLESFNSVQFRGPGILTIVEDEEESLEINAPGYMLNEIQSTVVKEELLVGYVASSIVSLSAHREKIQYRLKIRNLKQLFVKGSGDVVLPDLDNDQFSIVVTGSGVTKVDQLTADRLDVSISGSGRVEVGGDVESQTVKLSGSGSYFAEKLVSDFANVILSGSGQAEITTSDELSAVISGSGLISYSGYPDVYKQISGSGSLTRRRRETLSTTNGRRA
jgi:hypothetical protein